MPESKEDLLSSYQPAPMSLEGLGQVELLLIVGPSGVGKTSISTGMGIPIVLSDNSRQPRVGEQEGVEYRFRTEAEILADLAKGNYVQAVIDSGGDIKGTHIGSFPSSGLAILTPIAEEVPNIRSLPFKKTTAAFIVPPSYMQWMERMRDHRLDENQLRKRLAEAARSFKFALNDENTHFILNDNLDDARAQLKALLEGVIDQDREQKARQISAQILDELEAKV